MHLCGRCTGRARRTVRRRRDWLARRSETFTFFLRSRFAQLGRTADHASFWRNVLAGMSLAQAMAWLDAQLNVP